MAPSPQSRTPQGTAAHGQRWHYSQPSHQPAGAPPPITCSSCVHAPQQPQPHQPTHHSQQIGEQLSSDTCGPIRIPPTHGNVHIFTCIDTEGRYLVTYYIRRRQQNQPNNTAIIPHTRATKRNSTSIQNLQRQIIHLRPRQSNIPLSQHITHKTHKNTPHEPQENSIAERIIKTLFTNARAALHHSAFPPILGKRSARCPIKIQHYETQCNQSQPLNTLARMPSAHDENLCFRANRYSTYPRSQNKAARKQRTGKIRVPHIRNSGMTVTIRKPRYRVILAIDFNPYVRHQDSTYFTCPGMHSKQSPRIQKRSTESTACPINFNRPAQFTIQHHPHATSRQQGGTQTCHNEKPHTMTS